MKNLRPDYYNTESAYEPLKVIDAWDLNFRLGNAIKYIARAGKKQETDTLADLIKARTYLDLEIERIQGTMAQEEPPPRKCYPATGKVLGLVGREFMVNDGFESYMKTDMLVVVGASKDPDKVMLYCKETDTYQPILISELLDPNGKLTPTERD